MLYEIFILLLYGCYVIFSTKSNDCTKGDIYCWIICKILRGKSRKYSINLSNILYSKTKNPKIALCFTLTRRNNRKNVNCSLPMMSMTRSAYSVVRHLIRGCIC